MFLRLVFRWLNVVNIQMIVIALFIVFMSPHYYLGTFWVVSLHCCGFGF